MPTIIASDAPGNQSDTDELVELGKTLTKYDGIFTSHLRSYTASTLPKAMEEVAEDAARLVRNRAEAAGLTLDLEFPPELPEVEAAHLAAIDLHGNEAFFPLLEQMSPARHRQHQGRDRLQAHRRRRGLDRRPRPLAARAAGRATRTGHVGAAGGASCDHAPSARPDAPTTRVHIAPRTARRSHNSSIIAQIQPNPLYCCPILRHAIAKVSKPNHVLTGPSLHALRPARQPQLQEQPGARLDQ